MSDRSQTPDAAKRCDYAVVVMPQPMILPVICAMCQEPHLAGHVCPALRDLSPMGGGPNPWKDRAR